MSDAQEGRLSRAHAEPEYVYVLQRAETFPNDSGAELGRYLGLFWERRWFVLALSIGATLLAGTYAFVATPSFRAEAVLSFREGKSGLGLAQQLSQYSGLAALAGISVGSVGRQEPLGLIRSRGFTRRFIENNHVVDLIAAGSDRSLSLLNGEGGAEYDIRKLVDDFSKKVISITEDKKSGLVIVAVTWRDPNVAANWANALVRQANEEMRARALTESENNIRYLSQQLQETEIVGIQQSISRVLEAEIQQAMLAKAGGDFVFNVIDNAEPPVRRLWPRRALILFGGMCAGFLIAVVLVALDLLRNRIRLSAIPGRSD